MNARRLRVELAPSAPLAIAVLALHAAAALSVLAVLPGASGIALAVLLALLGAASAWSRALLRSSSSVRALEIGGPQLGIELAGGASFVAEVGGRRYIGRYMVVLPLRSPTRRTLLVTRDMADADSFRRLRIWALWGRLPRVAQPQLAA